jgi:hypothetical protein
MDQFSHPQQTIHKVYNDLFDKAYFSNVPILIKVGEMGRACTTNGGEEECM